MSIERYPSPTGVSLLLNASLSKVLTKALIVITLLLAMLFSLILPSAALAAVEDGVLGITGGGKGDSASEPAPDSFGRDTPRHTVQGFIGALGDNDYLLASNYLNLSKSDNPTTIVRQFKQALDTGGRFQADLQLNNTPEGNLTDQLPPSQENVGSISIGDNRIPLLLERVVSKKGEQYWQFSSETLNAVPEVIEENITGFVVKDKAQMIESIKKIPLINRLNCRESAKNRFDTHVVTNDYLTLFKNVI